MGLGSTSRLFPLWSFTLTQLSITVVQCPLCLVFCGLPECSRFKRTCRGICSSWETLGLGRLHCPLWPSFHTVLIVLNSTWHPAPPFLVPDQCCKWDLEPAEDVSLCLLYWASYSWLKTSPPPVRVLVWQLPSNFIKYSMSRNKTEPCFCMWFLAEMVLLRLGIKPWTLRSNMLWLLKESNCHAQPGCQSLFVPGCLRTLLVIYASWGSWLWAEPSLSLQGPGERAKVRCAVLHSQESHIIPTCIHSHGTSQVCACVRLRQTPWDRCDASLTGRNAWVGEAVCLGPNA